MLSIPLTALGCGGGAFGNFTDGLDLDRCDGTFPVCESTAGCVLTETTYTEGEFPGQRQVIVNAPAGAVLNVELFFVEQNAAGLDTEIRWHEPGCFETYRWLSDGEDVFRRAGESRVLAVSQQVREPGDHLVEIFSDAVATYRLRVRVDGL